MHLVRWLVTASHKTYTLGGLFLKPGGIFLEPFEQGPLRGVNHSHIAVCGVSNITAGMEPSTIPCV